MIDSVWPTVCHSPVSCQNGSSYDHAVFTEDSPMTLVSWRLTSAWNSKGNIGNEGAEWEEKMRILEPTAQMWMKIDPYMQRQKCRPMTLVSGNIRYVRIFAGVPLGGNFKWEWGCWRRQFFGDLSGYFFANFRDKTSSIIWRYATLCWPVTDCKMNDLEWLFRVKLGFRTSSFGFRGFDFEA